MELDCWEGVDEEKIKEFIEPFQDIFPELMKLVEKFDDEVNNLTSDAHIEVSVNLGSDGNKLFSYDYYAIVTPTSIDIVADEYTDRDADLGIARRIQMATIHY